MNHVLLSFAAIFVILAAVFFSGWMEDRRELLVRNEELTRARRERLKGQQKAKLTRGVVCIAFALLLINAA